jgi:hypothetical protein
VPTPTDTPTPMIAPTAVPTTGGGGSGNGPPPRPTPTPPPDCGQTGIREDSAPPGYASNPRGAEGQNHPVFGTGLTTLADRDAFRSSLPAGTSTAMVNDDIARGCSATWIQDHPESSTTTAQP